MKLRDWREAAGLNMAQFATMVGAHRSQILRIERGSAVPSKTLIERIFAETNGEVGPGDYFNLSVDTNGGKRK